MLIDQERSCDNNRRISGEAAIMNSGPMDFDLGTFNRRFY